MPLRPIQALLKIKKYGSAGSTARPRRTEGLEFMTLALFRGIYVTDIGSNDFEKFIAESCGYGAVLNKEAKNMTPLPRFIRIVVICWTDEVS